MVKADSERVRYSVCIACEVANGDVRYIRIADYDPDDAEEGNELTPAYCASKTKEPSERYANPRSVYCGAAYHNYESRDSDVYAFRWSVDPRDSSWQNASEWKGDDGRLMSDNVREVVTIPGVQNREDLVKALSRGYRLEGRTTRQFYLVYEYPAGGYMRFAIKCKRDDFIDKNGIIRLTDSVANVRQSILTAPIVVLSEEKIIRDGWKRVGRELYSSLEELPEEEGLLPLRTLDYYAADYVRYYLKHCRSVAKLADKERRYAVAQAIDEALAFPVEISKYLDGAECPDDEVARLREAIAAQIVGEDGETLALVQNALMENKAIREKCVVLAEKHGSAKLDAAHVKLGDLEKQMKAKESAKNELEVKIESLEKRECDLRLEVEKAENRLAKLNDAEKRLAVELEDNVALRLGLKAVCHSQNEVPSSHWSTSSLVVSGGTATGCDRSDKSLADVLEENLRKLGASWGPSSRAGLRAVAVGAAACVGLGVPMAAPEPAATVLAVAMAAALRSAEPTRVVIPADCRDMSAISEAVGKPGVYLVEGVIDAVNEGALFHMLRGSEDSVVVFSFRSHASALLLAREVWDSLFVPSAEALVWPRFKARPERLTVWGGGREIKSPRKNAVTDRADELSQPLRDLGLPYSSFVLPAAVTLVAEDEYDEPSYEPIVSQHLVLACGGKRAAAETLTNWGGESEEAPAFEELMLRIGSSSE